MKRTTHRLTYLLFAAIVAQFHLPMQRAGAQVGGDSFQATNSAGTSYFMGKVGVGTTNPTARLHVVGDSQVDGGLTVSGAMKVPKQGDVDMGSYTNGESMGGVSAGGGGCVWATNAAGDVYVLQKIGIGTNSPVHELDVNGAIRAQSGGFVFPDGSTQTTALVTETNGATLISNTKLSIDGGLELNSEGTGWRFSAIDFHGDDYWTDYADRFLRNCTGPNSEFWFSHRGTGAIRFCADEGATTYFENTAVIVKDPDYTVAYEGYPKLTLTTNMYFSSVSGGTAPTQVSSQWMIDNNFTTISSTGTINNQKHAIGFSLGAEYQGYIIVDADLFSKTAGAAITAAIGGFHDSTISGGEIDGVSRAKYDQQYNGQDGLHHKVQFVRPFLGSNVFFAVYAASVAQTYWIKDFSVYGVTNGLRNFTGTP